MPAARAVPADADSLKTALRVTQDAGYQRKLKALASFLHLQKATWDTLDKDHKLIACTPYGMLAEAMELAMSMRATTVDKVFARLLGGAESRTLEEVDLGDDYRPVEELVWTFVRAVPVRGNITLIEAGAELWQLTHRKIRSELFFLLESTMSRLPARWCYKGSDASPVQILINPPPTIGSSRPISGSAMIGSDTTELIKRHPQKRLATAEEMALLTPVLGGLR